MWRSRSGCGAERRSRIAAPPYTPAKRRPIGHNSTNNTQLSQDEKQPRNRTVSSIQRAAVGVPRGLEHCERLSARPVAAAGVRVREAQRAQARARLVVPEDKRAVARPRDEQVRHGPARERR
jgi:hypothetical protein